MRPWFETVVIPADSSWLLYDRKLSEFPFNWHVHPEFELTLTLNSTGMRFVGDHAETYGDGDLVLLGPNLPHAWQSSATLGDGDVHRALVCWFTEPWINALIETSPELSPLRTLLEEAGRGVAFGEGATARIRQRLPALTAATATERWMGLLDILLRLSREQERRPLASGHIAPTDDPRDQTRLARVIDWLNAHYDEPVRLKTLAEIARLSESQLQRIFKRSTRLTVSGYVAQLRIGHACALLAQGNPPVALVGEAVGYPEPAHFTRQFRAAKGVTPSAYRRLFRS